MVMQGKKLRKYSKKDISTEVKILILTQYYPPETGAPQNRLSSLAYHLKSFGNAVEIMTAMPNYPKYEIFEGYKGKRFYQDTYEGIPVFRSAIYVTRKKALTYRLLNYLSFAWSAYFSAKKHCSRPDILVCESPPLFLGITALKLKKYWGCKMVFNVSDLWPESAEKMGLVKNRLVLKYAHSLAATLYRKADMISGQTQGIVAAIQNLERDKKILWMPNGIDASRFTFSPDYPRTGERPFRLLYAGILGHAQGLEVILASASLLKEDGSFQFYIIGDGPQKAMLLELKQSLDLGNVSFIDNQPADKIAEWLQRCDAYIVPLRKLELFKGAIPSKLFEPLYFAKPILLGVDGEARQLFIEDAKAGLYNEPENAEELAENIRFLAANREHARILGENGKAYVEKYFQRKSIAEKFYLAIQEL